MAHWIIEDHGFGGQYYKCSNCGEVWCDLFYGVSSQNKCPECGENLYYKKNKKNVICKKKGCSFKREEEITEIE